MRTITLPAGTGHARIEVDETDHIGRIITRGTWYEKDLLDDARHRVTGPGTAIDVGAHIGNHALWFALAMGLNVIALEPNSDTFAQLVRNVEANELILPDPVRPYVRVLNVAAGAQPGWGRVTPPALAGNSGTCAVARERDTVQVDADHVPITTLDDLLLVDPVRLIKIDVEGSARDVLAGAQRILAEQGPVIYAEADPDELFDLLAPAGYRCFGRFAKTPTWGFARG